MLSNYTAYLLILSHQICIEKFRNLNSQNTMKKSKIDLAKDWYFIFQPQISHYFISEGIQVKDSLL